jgi:hypothetical protein
MNINNFFVKFAYYYKKNLNGIKVHALDLCKEVIYFFGNTILEICVIPIEIILIFIPVIQIFLALTTEYLDKETAAKEAMRLNGISGGAGYYFKKKLRERCCGYHRKKAQDKDEK